MATTPLTQWASYMREASVDEERCVVRDSMGDLWRRTEYGADSFAKKRLSEVNADVRDDYVLGRTDALRVAADGEEAVPGCAPLKLYRLVKKPKPRAPREVFVIQLPDGSINQWIYEVGYIDKEDLGPGDRFVRYVLAEGE